MGQRGQKIREAIAHLAGDGCDLTDPDVSPRLRADDVAFHLGYLEEHCGFDLTVDEVLAVARGLMKELDGLSLGARRPSRPMCLIVAPGPEIYN
jgi:hypothetical protein